MLADNSKGEETFQERVKRLAKENESVSVESIQKELLPERIFSIPTVPNTYSETPYINMEAIVVFRKERMAKMSVEETKLNGSENQLFLTRTSTKKDQSRGMLLEDVTEYLPLHEACREGNLRNVKLCVEACDKNEPNSDGLTPLMIAAGNNHLSVVAFLLSSGVRRNNREAETLRTALHFAVLQQHDKVVSLLLANGGDPRLRDSAGQTPLHLALTVPSTKPLQAIVRHVTKDALMEGDDEQMTPIHLAVLNDYVKHLQILLNFQPSGTHRKFRIAPHEFDITFGDVEGKTPLHWSAQISEAKSYSPTIFHRPVSCAKLLIRFDPKLLGVRDIEGRTALHLAASLSNNTLIELLCSSLNEHSLELTSMLNAQDVQGRTAMHYAALAGYSHIISILKRFGGDDSIQEKEGATVLHFACSKNHVQVARMLISNGRLVFTSKRDNLGRNPVHWAALKGYSEAIRILLEAGLNPNEVDERQLSALHICAIGGHSHGTTILLEHGASVDTLNGEERSALFLAVQNGHGEVANVLIHHGADVHILDPDGRTALHWAALAGHLSIVSLLISCGAEINLKCLEGKTPVQCAAYNGHNEVVSFLVKNGAKLEIRGI